MRHSLAADYSICYSICYSVVAAEIYCSFDFVILSFASPFRESVKPERFEKGSPISFPQSLIALS